MYNCLLPNPHPFFSSHCLCIITSFLRILSKAHLFTSYTFHSLSQEITFPPNAMTSSPILFLFSLHSVCLLAGPLLLFPRHNDSFIVNRLISHKFSFDLSRCCSQAHDRQKWRVCMKTEDRRAYHGIRDWQGTEKIWAPEALQVRPQNKSLVINESAHDYWREAWTSQVYPEEAVHQKSVLREGRRWDTFQTQQ